MAKKRRIPRADDTLPRPSTNHTGCECRNHLGMPKTQHRSKDDALKAIMRRHLPHGQAFTVYPCPTSNRFHVATVHAEVES